MYQKICCIILGIGLAILSTGCVREPFIESSISSGDTPAGQAGESLEQLDEWRNSLSLTYSDLMNGFEFTGPQNELALTPPLDAQPASHRFEGRLELLSEQEGGYMENIRGELEPTFGYLPEFDYEFVQTDDGYLVPVRRGLIVADHPYWNLHLEPGRVWQEPGDQGYSRASLPFTLSIKGSNSAYSGTLTFLFDEQSVSRVWYQVTQEVSTYYRINLWGLLDAVYHPQEVDGADEVGDAFARELEKRYPTKPIEEMAVDYPGVDLTAFGSGVTPEHLSWYGFIIDGVNYVGGCRTRFGIYPYCDSMRVASFSTAKSAFASVALMRLAQKYGADVPDLLIKDYVPEYALGAGDWEKVTFENALDMATGNYFSTGFMEDDNSQKMGEFFGAQPFDQRIAAAFTAPSRAEPGTRWVYRTSDTFILMTAMQRFLQGREGEQADIFDLVVNDVYLPLGVGPGFLSSMRTADNNWQGQAEGGYGLWWTPDDVAKIIAFLNRGDGKIDGEQVLHPGMLAASLQRDADDRGVRIDTRQMYNNAFWATRYSAATGFDCEFWITEMQGVSGNVIALFPNGTVYYYFSDNQEFTWSDALREADRLTPICPGD